MILSNLIIKDHDSCNYTVSSKTLDNIFVIMGVMDIW